MYINVKVTGIGVYVVKYYPNCFQSLLINLSQKLDWDCYPHLQMIYTKKTFLELYNRGKTIREIATRHTYVNHLSQFITYFY